MQWNDWLIVCWTLSALLCLLGRRWMDATSSACFALFLVLDRMPAAVVPWQLSHVFLLAGATLVVHDVLKTYRRYKESPGAR